MSTVIDGDQTPTNSHLGQLAPRKSSGIVASSVSPRELTLDPVTMRQDQTQTEAHSEAHDPPSPLSELTEEDEDDDEGVSIVGGSGGHGVDTESSVSECSASSTSPTFPSLSLASTSAATSVNGDVVDPYPDPSLLFGVGDSERNVDVWGEGNFETDDY